MPGLMGQVKSVPNTSGSTSGLNTELAQWLSQMGRGGGFGDQLFPSGGPKPGDVAPYEQFFKAQTDRALAQGKEQAGNLTGSGYANIMGQRAGEAATQQGAYIADIFERRRTSDADRFLQTMLGTMGSNAAGQTTMYQPGFLDSLMGMAGQAAQGGMFNSLFPSGAAAVL